MTKQFKSYEQHQSLLLPPSLGELIGEKDLVRVVDRVVDEVAADVVGQFPGGGCPPYHPKMMLKVLIYGYCMRLYSCRKIAKALKRDVGFMWLSGMQQPDFNTVNRFRGEYLKDSLPRIFAEVVKLLLEEGYVRFENYFLDGTKMEADANQYKVTWRKNTERYKAQVEERVREILKEVEEINRKEDQEYEGKDLPEWGEGSHITSEKIREVAKAIEEKLKGKQGAEAKELGKKVKALEEEAKKEEKYEAQEKTLGERNSFSTTDPDATAMRMKNKEIRPAYNVQAAAESGFVTGYSVGQNRADSAAFVNHMEKQREWEVPEPKRVIADAAYGTEENFAYLERQGIGNHLKYSEWYTEQSRAGKYEYHKTRFTYEKDQDRYRCPQNQALVFRGEHLRKYQSGYVAKIRVYEGISCAECPVRTLCTKSPGNRTVHTSSVPENYQRQARENFTSESGECLRKRRGHEIETVFGDVKHNQKFRRFSLRGLAKVWAESALIFISYNIRKLFARNSVPQFA